MPLLFSCFATEPDCAPADAGCAPITVNLLQAMADSSFSPLYIVGKFNNVGGILEQIGDSQAQQIGTFGDMISAMSVVRLGSRIIVGGDTGSGCLIKISDSEGADWQTRDCLDVGDAIVDLAYGNDMVVAVGRNGLVRVSLDGGSTWTAGATVSGSGNFNALHFLNGSFFAATSSGGVYTSTDPLNIAFANPGGGAPSGVQIINQTVDASGDYYGVNLSSSTVEKFDGTTWTTSTNLFNNREATELAYALVSVHGRQVAVGGGLGTGHDCFVDFARDGVNFDGGAKMSASCSDLASESYLINKAFHYNNQYIATGIELGAGTNKAIYLTSTTGAAGQWNAYIGDAQTLYADFYVP